MKKILILFLFISAFADAQYNRANQAANITSNIYTNGQNKITGAVLQGVMLNQNNSYCNLISDTNLLDVRQFSPYATYTPGMGVFYGDSLFMNLATAHGTWNYADWVKIAGGCACSTLVKYADTTGGSGLGNIATLHYVTYNLVAWADTNTKISSISNVRKQISIMSVQHSIPLTGNTVTATSEYLSLEPAGTLATLTIDFPVSPSGGQLFIISSTQTITSMTFYSGTTPPEGYSGPTTFYPGTIKYIYNSNLLQWRLN